MSFQIKRKRKTLMTSLHRLIIAVFAVTVVDVIQAVVPGFPTQLRPNNLAPQIILPHTLLCNAF